MICDVTNFLNSKSPTLQMIKATPRVLTITPSPRIKSKILTANPRESLLLFYLLFLSHQMEFITKKKTALMLASYPEG